MQLQKNLSKEIKTVTVQVDGSTVTHADTMHTDGAIRRHRVRPVVHNDVLYMTLTDLGGKYGDIASVPHTALSRGQEYHGSVVREATVDEIVKLTGAAVTDRRSNKSGAFSSNEKLASIFEIDGRFYCSTRQIPAGDEHNLLGHRRLVKSIPLNLVCSTSFLARKQGVSGSAILKRANGVNSSVVDPSFEEVQEAFPGIRIHRVASKLAAANAAKVAKKAKKQTITVKSTELLPRLPVAVPKINEPVKTSESAKPSATADINLASLLPAGINFVGLLFEDGVLLCPITKLATDLIGEEVQKFATRAQVSNLVANVQFIKV